MMKNIKENIKEKISIIFIIALVVLSTIFACTVFATNYPYKGTTGNVHSGTLISEGEDYHMKVWADASYTDDPEIENGPVGLEILDNPQVFCCSKGTALPSQAEIDTTALTLNGVNYGRDLDSVVANEGKYIYVETTSGSCSISSPYKHRTLTQFKESSRHSATPKEAYILAEMKKCTPADGEYNYLQMAWWTTEANEGKSVADTAFSLEADAFEEYIASVGGCAEGGNCSEGECNYTTIEFEDINSGNLYTVPNCFDINYQVGWHNEDEYANPTVVYDEDTQQYTIGPFAINYEGTTQKFGNRDTIQFAGITSMNLYTDLSEDPLVLGQDWNIICAKTVMSTTEGGYEYPASDTPFYIVVNYKEGMTRITDIQTNFRYMNAAGSYIKYRGSFYSLTWRQSKTVDNYDDLGNYINTDYYYSYSAEEKEAQCLAWGCYGIKWYQYVTLSRSVGLKQNSIEIKKIVVDEAGNPIDTDEAFTFKVTVNGAANAGTDYVKVKANSSAESKVFYWTYQDEDPTYSVEEVNIPDGYEMVNIENASGTLKENTEVVITCKNKVTAPEEKEGKLVVVKQIQNTELPTNKYSLIGQTFNFNVTITGKEFKVNDTYYTEDSVVVPVTAVATTEGDLSVTSPEVIVKWYDEEAPKYEVEEVNLPEGAELVSISPNTGTFKDDSTATVVAVNKYITVGAEIHVIKTLENADYLTEEEIKAKHFNFKITVEGYDTIYVKTDAVRKDGIWVWEYTTSKYVWNYGNNPTYTVEEYDNPVGTVVVSGTVSGTLQGSSTEEFVVDCPIQNKVDTENPYKSGIEITKVIEGEILKNRNYQFQVTITGRFKFENESNDLLKQDRTIRLTNGGYVLSTDEGYDSAYVTISVGDQTSTTWSSDGIGLGKIIWYTETAPTYKVEENLNGQYGVDVINSSINPQEGYLSDVTDGNTLVKVTATNVGEDKPEEEVGYIHIIKTLQDADKFTPEYIDSLHFTFNITVEGHESQKVELEAQRVDNSYVWEYTSDKYFWNKGENAPTYTIEEILLPDGCELVSANGPEGSTTTDGVISGTLKASENEDYLITTDNTFINKLTPGPEREENKEYEGNIVINKKITSSALYGINFNFKIKLEGTFEYEGTQYVQDSLEISATVSGGSDWTSPTIKWWGDDVPQYNVEEVENENSKVISIVNGSGVLVPNKITTTVVERDPSTGIITDTYTEVYEDNVNVNVSFVNDVEKDSGYITIEKTLNGGASEEAADYEYTFRISVEGYQPYDVTIKAGETYKSEVYTWAKISGAPTYTVEEINLPTGVSVDSISNQSGILNGNGQSVVVTAVNQINQKQGTFSVTKTVVEDKANGAANTTFPITIRVSSNSDFECSAGTKVTVDGVTTYVIEEMIGTDETKNYTVKWYSDEAPTVTVSEDLSELDSNNNKVYAGYVLDGISNNGSPLSENENLEIVVTNEYETLPIIEIIMEMGGIVWDDKPLDESSKNTSTSYENGLYDEGETGVPGVKVLIYDDEGNLANIYNEANDPIDQTLSPIVTDSTGNWYVPRVRILRHGTYHVHFVYDGQTYEPTTAMVSGSADEYIAASNTQRTDWFNNSMAVDIDRDEVNSRLETISGNTAIDGDLASTGTASNGDTILYQGEVADSGRVVSKAVTTDANGVAYDLYQATAATEAVGLNFPLDNKMNLIDYDISLSELGTIYHYTYKATGEYLKHINLGLVERDIADVDVMKDLVDAKVIVNNKLVTYKFNKLSDLGQDKLTRETYFDGDNALSTYSYKYELGFYKTDYYYRAEIYESDTVYDALEAYYTSMDYDLEDTELEIYLRYKITVSNESESYLAEVKEVNDYFDSSLELVNDTVTKYVESTDGTASEENKIVAEKSDANWTITQTNINGSDGLTYNKMTTDYFAGTKLASGESKSVYVDFKVTKDSINGVNESIETADKSNIVELSKYSTYDTDGNVAGRIDNDSAADNINITNYNIKGMYEDDTDQAPILEIDLYDETSSRTVEGIAWEDNKVETTDNTAVGNGIYDEGDEALIGGLTTELVEEIKVENEDGTYTEYEFLWPTNENLGFLGGRTIEDLTGFDSTTETSRTIVKDENDEVVTGVGGYSFTGIPTGNYSVRFLYGNNKSDLDDSFAASGDPVAYDKDGNIWSGDEKIYTANYDGDNYGYTAAVYNGQDYKSTVYQANNDNKTEYQSLDEYTDYDKDSDAYDSESRRLNVIAESETITNVNGSVLRTADTTYVEDEEGNKTYTSHDELYDGYNMYADTAKLRLNSDSFENSEAINVEVTTEELELTDSNVVKVFGHKENTDYEVTNVDFGLIERPENNIILDKQINQITLTTNTGNTIFDAAYDISYEVVHDGIFNDLSDKTIVAELGNNNFVVAKVELASSSVGTGEMQAINKNESKLTNRDTTGTKNFRYVNVDDSIIQGTTVTLGYTLTAINASEEDFITNALYEKINKYGETQETVNAIRELAQEAYNNEVTYADSSVRTLDLGNYISKAYYTGIQDESTDIVVVNKVRQLVDYIDNDALFAAENNSDASHSWQQTTVVQLLGNGSDSDRLIDESLAVEGKLLDKNGIEYVTEGRNNLVLSVDSIMNKGQGDKALNNDEFEKELSPITDMTGLFTDKTIPDESLATIKLTATKQIGTEEDADNLAFDNISEIVKFENTAGRRDEAATVGNANPANDQFEESLDERDQSATEIVTFSPPQGLEVQSGIGMQVLLISLVAIVIVAGGVIIIKKKVL